MKTLKQISIPEPCSQNWDGMTPSTGGRHCAHCCKTVTDFTVMSNQQIIDTLANSSNICGRFNQPQLHKINLSLQPKKDLKWKWLGLAASLLFTMQACKTMGQPRLTGKVLKTDTSYRTVGGTIKHSKANKHIKGSGIKTNTDNKAHSRINIPLHTDTLVAHQKGFETVDLKLNDSDLKTTDIQIIENLTGIVGGVRIVGIEIKEEKRPLYQTIYDMLIGP